MNRIPKKMKMAAKKMARVKGPVSKQDMAEKVASLKEAQKTGSHGHRFSR